MTIDPKTLLPGDIITVRLAVSQVYENGVVIASSDRSGYLHRLRPSTEILSVERPKPKVGDFVQCGGGCVWEIISGPRVRGADITEFAVWNPELGYSFLGQFAIDIATIVDRPDWAEKDNLS